MSAPACLVWFRRDLRLNDHVALAQALTGCARVHCAFVFDTDLLDPLSERADRRVEFIRDSVAELADRLRARGSVLHALHGPARRLIPQLAERLGVAEVHANRDYEPFARHRDAAVEAQLARRGVRLVLHKDQVIFDTDDLLTTAGTPYRVFTPYRRAWLTQVAGADLEPHTGEEGFRRLAPAAGHVDRVPSLAELGFRPTGLAGLGVRPGEEGARRLWKGFLERLDRYKELRDYPAADAPSRLSVHLRFGTISIRELVRAALARGGEGADAWLSELIWREFYQMLLWHFPETVGHAFQSRYDGIRWPNPPGHFEAWRDARTGYPIIDAAMRQLAATGYLHNRLRMLAASFLVKDLHVDWRLGEACFAQRLIDYEQASNVGGWQWSASVGTDAQPWFRVFNPVGQSRRFDPQGQFIRRYLPELTALPDRHLHAPWTLAADRQAACGVLVGRDYPPPIVDHGRARIRTLALFRGAGAGLPGGAGSATKNI